MKWLLLLMAAVVLLSACGTVKIGRINADPGHFANRTVRVEGTVTTAMGVLGTGGYQVRDDTGSIFVLSRTGVPAKGARVKVTGKVMSGANILGRSVGTAIREESHKARY
ncbi:MAG: hypothetical protein ACE15B_02850 [Bryobacteraceae bacterium]